MKRWKQLTSLAVAAVLAAEPSFALADLPVGAQGTANAAVRGNGSLQRALDSRAAVLQRANARGRVQTGIDASAQAGAASRAGVGARANGGVGIGAGLGDPLSRPDLRPSVQTGTGRLARELVRDRLDALRSRTDLSGRVDVHSEAYHRGRSDDGGRAVFDRPADGSSDRPGTGIVTVGAEVIARGRAQALANADDHLARRLAEIDRLRDRALETGDEQLLQRADRLEVIARWQHEQRLAVDAGTPRPVNGGEDAERPNRPLRHPFGRLNAGGEVEAGSRLDSSVGRPARGANVEARGGVEASATTEIQTSAGN